MSAPSVLSALLDGPSESASERALGLARPPFRRAAVVANPISGRGRSVRTAGELVEGLRRAGVAAELFVTRERGDGLRHLRALGTELDLALAVGGDGTLREVLEGLVEPETPVGLVPTGTANVLAHALGLPRDVHLALEVVLGGRLQTLDTAEVDGRLSFLCVGVGFDAWAVHQLEAGRSGPLPSWSQAWQVLRALALFRPRELSLRLDGERLREPCGSVLVANTTRYAGGIKLAADSRLDDGLLEVYVFPTARRLELASALLRGLVRGLPGGPVRMHRARHIAIEADEPVPCQVDGEASGSTPVSIAVGSRRYRILVP